jgi:uncharacterized membrane protein
VSWSGLGPLALLVIVAVWASRVRHRAMSRSGAEAAPPVAVYTASARIEAPIERVWAVLEDVLRWPEWTPTVTHVEALGPPALAPGAAFRVHQPGLQPAVWEVGDVVRGERFAWSSRSPGVRVRADHALVVEDGATTLHLRLEMRGMLAPIVVRFFGEKTAAFVAKEAVSLKARSEAP